MAKALRVWVILLSVFMVGCASSDGAHPEGNNIFIQRSEQLDEYESVEEGSQVEIGIASGTPTEYVLFHETTARINTNLPYFSFRIYNRGEGTPNRYLCVVDTESGDVISTLELGYIYSDTYYLFFVDIELGKIIHRPENDEIRVQARRTLASFQRIEFVDVNFDGYKDIRILGGFNNPGSLNEQYFYFVWEPYLHEFISDPYGLNSLGLSKFDEEDRTIRSRVVFNSLGDTQSYWHKHIDGELLLVQISTSSRVWAYGFCDNPERKERLIEMHPRIDTIWREITRERDINTGDFFVTSDKLRLFADIQVPLDEALLTEIDFDSEMRELLSGLF